MTACLYITRSSPEPSPPPLKRRRISAPSPHRFHHLSPPLLSTLTSSSAHDLPSTSSVSSLRIYSWNINGIGPFLPPSLPPITNFLKPASGSNTSSKPTPPEPSLQAKPKRWKWPHILCLQEVKIAPTDTKTQASIRRVVNTPLDPDDENNPNRHLYDAHFYLSRDQHNVTDLEGKVYNVYTLIRRDMPDPFYENSRMGSQRTSVASRDSATGTCGCECLRSQ